MDPVGSVHLWFLFFFLNDPATTEIYTLSLHDALPICSCCGEEMEFDDVAATVAHELGHLTEPYISEDETYEQQEEKALHYEYFYSDVITITEHILETLHIDIEMHLSKN